MGTGEYGILLAKRVAFRQVIVNAWVKCARLTFSYIYGGTHFFEGGSSKAEGGMDGTKGGDGKREASGECW
jgi:hypothetical protein